MTFSEISRGYDVSFRLLFENSLDAIVIADDHGKFLDVNANACDLFGYSREEILLMHVGDLITLKPSESEVRYQRYLEIGQESGEFTFVRPDNDVRVASYSACRLAPGQHLGILRDITERRREQERTNAELARQARLFDMLLSSIADFAYTFNREGRITYVNQALLVLWQRRLEDTLGKNFLELDYPPELAARLQDQIQHVFNTGWSVRDVTAYTGPAGTTGHYEYIFVPVFGRDRQVEAVAGSTRDITASQREKAEKDELVRTLEVERKRLTDLFRQAPAFIAVLRGPEHVFERINPPYLQMVGRRELLGKPVREAFPEIKDQGFFEILDEVYRTGTPFVGKDMRILFREKEGAPVHEHYIDFVYQPLVEADGSVSGIFAHGIDLTERKRAEDALRERQGEIEVLNQRLRHTMTEIHHRVKNNLQIISALIDIEIDRRQDTVPVSEIVRLGRNIQALGVIHDILTHESKGDSDTETISIKRMFEQFLPLLESTLGERRLLRQVEDLILPGKHATFLALIANELVSNAAKYGVGDIELSFKTEGNRATLEVCDDGPGFVEGFNPEAAGHTRLELIENIARHDLRAVTSYENRLQGGARVVLTFPLTHS